MKWLRGISARTFALAFVTLAVALIAIAVAIVFELSPAPDQGLRLAYENGQVVVASVGYGTTAQRAGLTPGDVVVRIDSVTAPVNWSLVQLNVLEASDADKMEIAKSAASQQWAQVATVRPDELALAGNGRPTQWHFQDVFYPFNPAPLVVGLAILILGWWWLGSGRAGSTLRPYALSLPVATAVPLLALPIVRYPTALASVTGSLLVALAMLPLAIDFVARLDGRRRRWLVGALAVGLAVASALAGLLIPTTANVPAARQLLENGLILGPMAMLPVACVFLWRTERGRRRWLIALAGLALAAGSVQLGILISNGSYGPPGQLTIYVAGVQLPPNLDLFGNFLVQGHAIAPLAMLPLAVVTIRRVTGPRNLWFTVCVAFGLVAALTFAAIYVPDGSEMRLWRVVLAGAVVFLPGLLVARPFDRPDASVGAGPTTRSLIASLDVAMAALTPGVACIGLVFAYSIQVWPILLWLALLLVAARFTFRPLARLASGATRQRDLVVAATEAERFRIAADIHDDALQDLTMLIRRLDAAGDTANAQAAREIAERLRAICGDLRLPVLDDLGVGPALDWLCGRLDTATDEISLDRLAEESRLPADIELAVFRVAQEALSNAVRHGAAPVVVRYRAHEGWVELEVDDSGAGLAEGAAEMAEQTGHLGLLNMAQRAEAVGARLAIRHRPGGGTRVSFIWEPAVVPVGAAAPAPAPA
jgi:signal transduction histidine kinase